MEVTIDGVKYIPAPPALSGKGLKEVLNITLDDMQGNAMTIRDYFHKLLVTLWEEGEGFSGKRPFGNSGWEYDLYKPLLVVGLVEGDLDEDGDIYKVDSKEADKIIFQLIDEAFYGDTK